MKILKAFSNISIIAGAAILEVPQKYPFKILDKAIKIIAGHVTLMASIVLRSLMPYLPIVGAHINTKAAINNAQAKLNIVTILIVLIKLVFSFLLI